jgi:hypothetical protein
MTFLSVWKEPRCGWRRRTDDCFSIIKKSAAGSTHVVIDIPIGKTIKVRTEEDAEN